MPNGDFTNPRYFSENAYASDEDLKDKYGYAPRVNSSDYDCKRDYREAKDSADRVNGYDSNEDRW
jgi:hypothetical protein